MGLNIRLHGISGFSNPFRVSYRTGITPGNEMVIATGYTSYGSSTYPANTGTIVFTGTTASGASFDTNYWFKLTDTVTGAYIIEKLTTHQEEEYSFCLHCCDFDYNGTATYVAP